ncbi:MAG TPA: cation:proton antiporter [Chitinophaga sp.]|uniref:cation:proton antiporter domain-containing protein n=1 Tax=Chitinophaga sp. TaxID=1869181 RepID=UPI002CB20D0F|nr:cation:proton antiporter [Chitinophaga sp.]HVI48994.1 cation:proton antiporter [Chitinophaga sp.]
MRKQLLFYLSTLLTFVILVSWVITHGDSFFTSGADSSAVRHEPVQWNMGSYFLGSPVKLLIFQVIVILLVTRVFGQLAQRLKQPAVVGEMFAGIFMGPSLLGKVLPTAAAVLFPAASLGNLEVLSQFGLIFFMFTVGMESQEHHGERNIGPAVIISHAGIIIPFILGIITSFMIYEHYRTPQAGFHIFAIFTGIAMSITAFPVLARILQERNLTTTPLGLLIITCAAIDDFTAWCLLSIGVAMQRSAGSFLAVYTIAGALLFTLLMLRVMKPALKLLFDRLAATPFANGKRTAISFLLLLGAAYVTETIGIHLLFGAFLAGSIIPDSAGFKSVLSEKINDVGKLLLLPIFFILTGLRTEVTMLNEPYIWGSLAVLLLAAVSGKLAGCTLAARMADLSWKDSLMIGTLMNTRGLMELVVLNIGYTLGIFSVRMFTMMVLVAILTTVMTGPLLDLIGQKKYHRAAT